MGSWSKALLSSTLHQHPSVFSSSTPILSFFTNSSSSSSIARHSLSFPFKNSSVALLNYSSTYPLTSENSTPFLLSFPSTRTRFICRAAEYKFPDPIPEFADAVSFPFLIALSYLCLQYLGMNYVDGKFTWFCFFKKNYLKKLGLGNG